MATFEHETDPTLLRNDPATDTARLILNRHELFDDQDAVLHAGDPTEEIQRIDTSMGHIDMLTSFAKKAARATTVGSLVIGLTAAGIANRERLSDIEWPPFKPQISRLVPGIFSTDSTYEQPPGFELPTNTPSPEGPRVPPRPLEYLPDVPGTIPPGGSLPGRAPLPPGTVVLPPAPDSAWPPSPEIGTELPEPAPSAPPSPEETPPNEVPPSSEVPPPETPPTEETPTETLPPNPEPAPEPAPEPEPQPTPPAPETPSVTVEPSETSG